MSPSTSALSPSPPSQRLIWIFISMMLALIPVALDQSILSPAQITIQNSLDDHVNGQHPQQFSWVISVYLLTQTAFSLVWAQVLAEFESKWCYVSCIVLFALGSLIAGVAGTMMTLIVGRAIAGVGGAGIFICILTILAQNTEVAERARFMGLLGSVFGLNIIVAPLLGGSLSEYVSWRWCFYINLPICAVACLAAILLLSSSKEKAREQELASKVDSLRHRCVANLKDSLVRLASIDLVGLVLVLGFELTLTTPLQSVGINNVNWSSARILVPLCLTPLCIGLVLAWSKLLGAQRSLFPLDLLCDNRNLIGCSIVAFGAFWTLLIVTYYLALHYQVVRGVDATLSGVQLLPLMVSMITMVTGGGFVIKAWARYYPLMVGAPVFSAVGIGVLTTTSTHSSEALLAACQVLVGLGVGPLIQNPVLAAQANTANPSNVPRATGAVSFFQRLGGAFAIPVAHAVFNTTFQTHLTCHSLLETECDRLKTNPLDLTNLPLKHQAKTEALSAFVKALHSVYYCSLPTCILSLLAVIFLVSDTRLDATASHALSSKTHVTTPKPTTAQEKSNTSRVA